MADWQQPSGGSGQPGWAAPPPPPPPNYPPPQGYPPPGYPPAPPPRPGWTPATGFGVHAGAGRFAAPTPPRLPGTNGLAIASFVLAVVVLGGIGSLLAVIFGFMARGQTNHGRQAGRGLANAGIAIGFVGLIAMPFVWASLLHVDRDLDRIRTEQRSRSCDLDRRIVLTAGEAFFAQNDSYATSNAQLVRAGFLDPSESYDYQVVGAEDGVGTSGVSVRLTPAGISDGCPPA